MKTLKRADLEEEIQSGVYRFKVFAKHDVTAAFSGRRFRMNFAPGANRSVVAAHRKHFCELAGVPFERLIWLDQVHGSNIARVDKEDAGRGAKHAETALKGTDAAITHASNLTLSIHTADCAPVFFFDPAKRTIGMAHIGWRGAEQRLASKMVHAFRIQFLTKPENLMVAIGPMIRSCCYEVGPEFRTAFGPSVHHRSHGLFFDLAGWIEAELKSEGVLAERIYDSALCTVCENDRFPSYRKEGSEVRHMMSVLALNE